jgi:uncharacterized membrane protein YhhN
MTIAIVFGALSVAVILARILFFRESDKKSGFIAKLVASVAFCLSGTAAAFVARGIGGSHAAALMLTALVAALVGDVLLAMPSFVKDEFKNLFSALGGAAFLSGHVLYIIVFLTTATPRLYLLPVAAAVPLAYAVLIRTKVLQPKKNAVPVVAYGAVLGLLIFAAAGLAAAGTALGYFVLPAAVLFALSDTSLFFYNFGNKPFAKSKTAVGYLILLPYYAAQALFAAAILFL